MVDAPAVAGEHGESPVGRLPPERLYRVADLSALPFATTADLKPIDGLVGQSRALEALQFGTRIEKPGFNLFVIGPPGARLSEAVRTILRKGAENRASPSDWIYVNNFIDATKPVSIDLPAGRAPKFNTAMRSLIEDLKTALPAVFQSEDYQRRRGAIDENFRKQQGEAFSGLRDKAGEKGIVILRTPFGFALAPAVNGEVVPSEQFHTWPEAKRREIETVIGVLEKDLEHIVHQLPQWEKKRRDEVRTLNRETARFAVGQLIDETRAKFADLPRLVAHLEAVRTDLIENIPIFIAKSEDGAEEAPDVQPGGPFDRYEVNVLVTRQEGEINVPIIEEFHPTLGNLIGRVEYLALRGALVTNFRLIKAGALHRANGGYLLIDVRSLLMEAFSWPALKRTLRRGTITIEDVSRLLGFATTVSLEPDPIPLDLKVILFGDRLLYFLLAGLDPELGEHFKVLADFENDIDRGPQSEAALAHLVASIAADAKLKPFDREAVARLAEHAARLAGNARKLTLAIEQIRDVLTEADFWAGEEKRSIVGRGNIERAIEAKIHRAARLRDREQEAILEKTALIDTAGARVGQINALSVIELGGFSFGRPTRITCQVRPGSGKVVDIEREVELGGPIHSKGVLILSGFLAGRYALDTPMSLFASLVFEQSYGGVEGDSASSAELYALLSAVSDLALRQDLAVTGSVNQHGAVQAIGGVNEKIEGFFDICTARGLTGTQGVIVPQSNVQHLMLRKDVVDACAAGRFAIYSVSMIEEGIALLTGQAAGARGEDGNYPPGSVNRRVEDRLRAFASIRRSFAESRASEPFGRT